jgi:hypothetical protein
MTLPIILGLALISGVLGRMGGAKGYSTLFRDMGCSLVVVLAVIVALGLNVAFWWVYLAVFALHWAAFSTYWDWLFGGEGNLWFSGFMVGLALSPICFINHSLWLVVTQRALILCVIWGSLNKYLPKRILFWDRSIVEECLRYTISL